MKELPEYYYGREPEVIIEDSTDSTIRIPRDNKRLIVIRRSRGVTVILEPEEDKVNTVKELLDALELCNPD